MTVVVEKYLELVCSRAAAVYRGGARISAFRSPEGRGGGRRAYEKGRRGETMAAYIIVRAARLPHRQISRALERAALTIPPVSLLANNENALFPENDNGNGGVKPGAFVRRKRELRYPEQRSLG